MIVKTQGIVLKSFDLRETSRIVTFFTKEHGKVSGVLKGIRKDPGKFGSHADRFSVNDIVYYRYRNSNLHLVSQCDLRQFFFPVRQDLKKSLAASYVLELVYVIMPAEEKNEEVYELMMNFLSTLEETPDIDQLVHIFQIKTLLYSGFKPHLDTCLKCGKKVAGTAKFSVREGGLICLDCPAPDREVHLISRGTVASLLHIERSSWVHCLRLRFSSSTKKELKYILNNFLVYHLGRKLKSAQYLN